MKQPIVAVFGGDWSESQNKRLAQNCTPHFYSDDSDLDQVIFDKQPHIFATVGGASSDFSNVASMPKRNRIRWIHFTSPEDLLQKYNQLVFSFVNWGINYRNDPDMVTIFSTSYKSGDYIQRPFKTLMNQTYKHWEWVIFDDSDGDENWKNLVSLREKDPRIRVYRAEKNSGVIGHMKNLASSLARGGYLIEVDHDDELTPRALELCVQAGKDHPDAGFFHSDFVEIHEDGKNFKYGDMFGLGWGSYRKEWNEDRKMWVNVVNTIPINTATIRYLVGCPNHYRAWRTSVFQEVGGWNPHFHVADDYEMMARTFLKTKFVKIRHNCYYQYRNRGGNNHTFIRNREIQKLWHNISLYYNAAFHERFKELGVDDNFYSNWTNHRQWKKCWLNDRYDPHLCETFKVRGRNPQKPLVAVALVCYDPADMIMFKDCLEKVLNQSYEELQITAVGNCIPEWEKLMDSILQVWDKESELSNGAKKVNIERAKRDLRWWNIDKIYWFRACLNYISKASSEGDLVCYIDPRQRIELEKFHKNDFISRAVDMLVSDPELQMVYLKDTKHFVHRRDLYKKYGYWGFHKDLFEIWLKEEKCQGI